MKDEYVNIEETYNKDGFLTKITANGIPLKVPTQKFPPVKILVQADWIIEKRTMTKKEFDLIYPTNQ